MSDLKPADYLKPVSLAIRDRVVDRMLETESRYRHKDAKRLYYISMEWLMGRLLGNNLSNLRLEELCREVMASFGVSLDDVMESEIDAGLGNGGLGRLAACFLESMATLGMPGFGYGIDYEFGLFKQEIVNGFQREKPDRWKANGTPFQIEHPEEAVIIPMYGRVESHSDAEGQDGPELGQIPAVILGMPTDMPVVGYCGQTVNWLRLFTARALGRLRHRDLQPRRLHPRGRAEDPLGKHLARALSLRLGDEPARNCGWCRSISWSPAPWATSCAASASSTSNSSCCLRRSPSR